MDEPREGTTVAFAPAGFKMLSVKSGSEGVGKRTLALSVSLVMGASLLSGLPAEAKQGRGRGEAAPGVARHRTSSVSVPSGASRRPAPVRTARGRARFGHDVRFVGFHGHPFFPWGWWWFADFWWWGVPYGIGYPCVGPALCPGEVGYGDVLGLPSLVELDIVPESAVVVVDGEEVGYARDYSGAWDRLELGAGRHVIELSAPGYKTLRLELETKPGLRQRLVYALERGEGDDPRSTAAKREPEGGQRQKTNRAVRSPTKAFLVLRLEPGDAAVYLDGEFLGKASEIARLHGALAVAPGAHRLEVVRPGYRADSRDVSLAPGQRLELVLSLEPEAD